MGVEEVIFEPDELIGHVCFPTDGIISLLLGFEDGSAAEVGRVGNEARRAGPLANLLLWYTQRRIRRDSQLAACNTPYRRGKLSIIDPNGLEAAWCECYKAVKRRCEAALARA